MSERVELMRQRAREEAAEAQLRRAHARSLSKEPPPVVEKPKLTWWGAIRSTYGIVGGNIQHGGQIPPDRTPCRMCGVRADVGCKHTEGRV